MRDYLADFLAIAKPKKSSNPPVSALTEPTQPPACETKNPGNTPCMVLTKPTKPRSVSSVSIQPVVRRDFSSPETPAHWDMEAWGKTGPPPPPQVPDDAVPRAKHDPSWKPAPWLPSDIAEQEIERRTWAKGMRTAWDQRAFEHQKAGLGIWEAERKAHHEILSEFTTSTS